MLSLTALAPAAKRSKAYNRGMPCFILFLLLALPACSSLLNGMRKGADDSATDLDDGDSHHEPDSRAESSSDRKPDGVRPTELSASSDQSDSLRGVDGVSRISSNNTPIFIPKTQRQYKNGNRTTRENFIDQSQDEGSLWASGGQTNYFFTKNRVRSPGDLVTLILDDDLYRDMIVEAKRTLNYPEKETEINLAQESLTAKFIADRLATKKDVISTSAAAPEVPSAVAAQGQGGPTPTPSSSPANAGGEAKTSSAESLKELAKLAPKARLSDIDLTKSLDLKVGDSLMGEILERYPNGNYKIRAVKKVSYKNGPARFISVVGIVKNTDISEETDGIHSGRLYEYRVEVAH